MSSFTHSVSSFGQIVEMQESCSCHHRKKRSIIPILLFNKEGKAFKAFGNIGETVKDEFGFFTTHFFYIKEYCSDACPVTLGLLRPIDKGGCLAETIGEVYRLEKTPFTIEVHPKDHPAIQVIDSKLINRPLPYEPDK